MLFYFNFYILFYSIYPFMDYHITSTPHLYITSVPIGVNLYKLESNKFILIIIFHSTVYPFVLTILLSHLQPHSSSSSAAVPFLNIRIGDASSNLINSPHLPSFRCTFTPITVPLYTVPSLSLSSAPIPIPFSLHPSPIDNTYRYVIMQK